MVLSINKRISNSSKFRFSFFNSSITFCLLSFKLNLLISFNFSIKLFILFLCNLNLFLTFILYINNKNKLINKIYFNFIYYSINIFIFKMHNYKMKLILYNKLLIIKNNFKNNFYHISIFNSFTSVLICDLNFCVACLLTPIS